MVTLRDSPAIWFWRLGWRPDREMRVDACGTGQDVTPWPADGITQPWRWVQILGEAR